MLGLSLRLCPMRGTFDRRGLLVGWFWRGFRFGGFAGGPAPSFLGLCRRARAHRALHVLVGGGCGLGKLNRLWFRIVVMLALIAILFRGLGRSA